MIKLISSVQVDVGEFVSLHLPPPNGINNGGYAIPMVSHAKPSGYPIPAYSPIDLLCAALDGMLNGHKVENLTKYYDKHKIFMSFHSVNITIKIDERIRYMSIAQIRDAIKTDYEGKGAELHKVMCKNAPLCFKWMEV